MNIDIKNGKNNIDFQKFKNNESTKVKEHLTKFDRIHQIPLQIKQNNKFYKKILYYILLITTINSSNQYNGYYNSSIEMQIQGKGDQYILSPYFKDNLPDQIEVNGNSTNFKSIIVYDLYHPFNIIKMYWIYPLQNCNRMFYGLYNILEINLDNLKTSLVTRMDYMFYNCTSITSLDLKKFDTSEVTLMNSMFAECSSLLSINLNNWNFANVKKMDSIFENCKSLIYIHLSNFTGNTALRNYSYNISYYLMHYNPGIKICIDNFISSIHSNGQLSNGTNLCANDTCFGTNPKLIMEEKRCVAQCQDSEYEYEYKNLCYKNCPPRTKIKEGTNICEYLNCEFTSNYTYNISFYYYNYIQNECTPKIPQGFYENDSFHKTIDQCNIKCANCTFESAQYDLCLSCNKQYNYISIDNELWNIDNYVNCFNSTPDGYFYNSAQSTYQKCHKNCKTCQKEGNDYQNLCDSCYDNSTLFINTNCYPKCKYYYYFDSFYNYHCTERDNCTKEYRYKMNTNQSLSFQVKGSYYMKYKRCYKKCPDNSHISYDDKYICDYSCIPYNFFMRKCRINDYSSNVNGSTSQDEMIGNIKSDIELKDVTKLDDSEDIKHLLINISNHQQDYIVQEDNVIYTLTSVNNQIKNKYENFSSINLIQCEKKL